MPLYRRRIKTQEDYMLDQRGYCGRHRHRYALWHKVAGKLVHGRCMQCEMAEEKSIANGKEREEREAAAATGKADGHE